MGLPSLRDKRNGAVPLRDGRRRLEEQRAPTAPDDFGEILGDVPDRATAGNPETSETLVRLGGVAALLGGLAWTVKGTVILGGGDQPPLLFEAAPLLFGVALFGVANATMPPSRRRRAAIGLALVSVVAAVAALVSDLVGEVVGVTLAGSSLALLVGLLALDRRGSQPAPLAWWIGVAMVPALVAGGILSEFDERLLEIPLICIGLAWMVVGLQTLRTGSAQATS